MSSRQNAIPFPVDIPDDSEPDWREGKSITEIWKFAIQNPELTAADVRFLCGMQKTPILAHSTYIRITCAKLGEMIKESMDAPGSDELVTVPLPIFSPDNFRLFLEYLYTWEENMDLETALKLLPIAIALDCEGMKRPILKSMENSLNAENALRINCSLVSLLHCTLFHLSREVIQRNASKIIKSLEFYELSEFMVTHLVDHRLPVSDNVYEEAVWMWAITQCQKEKGRLPTVDEVIQILTPFQYKLCFTEELIAKLEFENGLKIAEDGRRRSSRKTTQESSHRQSLARDEKVDNSGLSIIDIIKQLFPQRNSPTLSMQKIKTHVFSKKTFKTTNPDKLITKAVGILVDEGFLLRLSGVGGVGTFTRKVIVLTAEDILVTATPTVLLQRLDM